MFSLPTDHRKSARSQNIQTRSLTQMNLTEEEFARMVSQNARLASENQRLREQCEKARSSTTGRSGSYLLLSAESSLFPALTKKIHPYGTDFQISKRNLYIGVQKAVPLVNRAFVPCQKEGVLTKRQEMMNWRSNH